LAAEHCPHGPNRREALMQWLEWVCALIPTRRQADDILDRIAPRRWSADALGSFLRVTDAERATLRITTIGSYQTPKPVREKRRKEKRRLAATARRQANGSKPREQSLSRTKPFLSTTVTFTVLWTVMTISTTPLPGRKSARSR
jgi:hypothetical protein